MLTPPTIVRGTTRVQGLQMHARSATTHAPPHAVPVVLVHGLGIASAYMERLAVLLAPHAPVYAPDLPGFGASEAPDGAAPDMPALAAHLRAWMDAEGIGRAALVANSLGCQVSAELAARWPSRVDRLVLVGPTLATPRSLSVQAWRLVLDAFREDPRLLPLHLADDLRAGPVRLWQTVQAMWRAPLQNSLPRVEAPVLVVRGTRDPLVSRRAALEAATLARQGSVLELPGAPHATNFSAAEELADAITPFLTGKTW